MKHSSTQLNSLVLLGLIGILGAKPLSLDNVGNTDAGPPAEYANTASTVVPEDIPVSVSAYHPRAVTIGQAGNYTPPDFTRFRDSKARKVAFYDYLLPMIREANEEVMRERAFLIGLAGQMLAGESLSGAQVAELSRIEKRYAIRNPHGRPAERVGELLLRVDVVPESLVLAQAAKESGWGTSRFARDGNNFFGIWCFYRGCGMTPLRRAAGRNHEVAMFDTVEEGVRYYIRTINTHVAYEELREMRAQARRTQHRSPGELLASGLIRYSERGLAYVREIQSMIRYNGLSRFTRSYGV